MKAVYGFAGLPGFVGAQSRKIFFGAESPYLPFFEKVGSFNFDNRKMVFENYLLPVMPNHTKSILDYDVQIRNLRPEATFFVPAETGKALSLMKKLFRCDGSNECTTRCQEITQ